MPFRAITGHRHILRLLSRAVGRRTLPQSLIFEGPDGIGKRSVASALAQAFNCERPIRSDGEETFTALPGNAPLPFDACGECNACRRIARGIHVDLIVLEPGESGSIKIDVVREATTHLAFRPFEGRRRVLIVDEAHALVAQAQNALLKTLEEPRPASVFVLITSRPDLLLPTVRSRCPRLRFGPLSPADVAAVLVQTGGWNEAEARAAAAAGDGSVARAIATREADFAGTRAAAHGLLEAASRTADARRLFEAAKQTGGRGGGTAAAEREELATRLRAVASVLRDLGILATRADAGLLANSDVKARLESLTTAFDASRTLRAFSAVDRALAALERNASPKIVADWLAFQL